MSIAHHRSIRKIAAFREHYWVEHPDATWFDASLAYLMQAGRQHVGDTTERAERDGREESDYDAFVTTARAFVVASIEPPKPTKERIVMEVRLGFASAFTDLLKVN